MEDIEVEIFDNKDGTTRTGSIWVPVHDDPTVLNCILPRLSKSELAIRDLLTVRLNLTPTTLNLLREAIIRIRRDGLKVLKLTSRRIGNRVLNKIEPDDGKKDTKALYIRGEPPRGADTKTYLELNTIYDDLYKEISYESVATSISVSIDGEVSTGFDEDWITTNTADDDEFEEEYEGHSENEDYIDDRAHIAAMTATYIAELRKTKLEEIRCWGQKVTKDWLLQYAKKLADMKRQKAQLTFDNNMSILRGLADWATKNDPPSLMTVIGIMQDITYGTLEVGFLLDKLDLRAIVETSSCVPPAVLKKAGGQLFVKYTQEAVNKLQKERKPPD